MINCFRLCFFAVGVAAPPAGGDCGPLFHSSVFPLPVCAAAPPKILALTVEGSEQSSYRALCQVQGSPLPDVQWLGPDDLLEGAPVGPLAQGTPAHYSTVSQLRDVEPGQQYTCSASNPLGKEQATLYVLHPRPPPPVAGASPGLLLLLSVSVGAKVILLVGVGVWIVQGGALQGASCWWK